MRHVPARWFAWPDFLHYKVARRIFSDFAGSGYAFARRKRGICRFWTRRAAERYADKLNLEEPQ